MKKIVAILALLLVTGACHKKVVSVHPGAISDYDSYSYDILTVEQSALNEAKAQYLAGNLPAGAKDPLNTAIAQYGTALAMWQGYHASGGDSSALAQAIQALVTAVGTLQQFLGHQPAPAKPIVYLNGGYPYRYAYI